MSDEQFKLLKSIRDALEAQPEEPRYENYEAEGNLDKYYEDLAQWEVVNDIYSILENSQYL